MILDMLPILSGSSQQIDFDFVFTPSEESLLATTDYGADITAAVALNNVTGTQFHPEKSGEVGLRILKAFAEW